MRESMHESLISSLLLRSSFELYLRTRYRGGRIKLGGLLGKLVLRLLRVFDSWRRIESISLESGYISRKRWEKPNKSNLKWNRKVQKYIKYIRENMVLAR